MNSSGLLTLNWVLRLELQRKIIAVLHCEKRESCQADDSPAKWLYFWEIEVGYYAT
jgi:hypothetical protein